MQPFICVRSMLDAPSFVHMSGPDDDPRHAAVRARRPLTAFVSGWLRRVATAFSREDAPWT